MSPEERDRLRTIEVQMQAVLKDYDDMRLELKEVIKRLDAIGNTLSEAKGGWRVLMLVGGAGAAIGGAIVKFVPLIAR